jgi:peptidoglycan/LPS O-acetylase OafA/YrhL
MSAIKSRINEMDALRGIAAILVILFHYTFKFSEVFKFNGFSYHFSFGHYGVELFFVISGFVIFMTVEKVSSPLEFVKKRWIRLYPTFLICMLLTFTVISLMHYEQLKVTWFEFLVNFSMVPSLIDVDAVDGVYWTLKVEVLFYAFIFFLLFTKQIQRYRLIGIAFLALTTLISIVYKFHPYLYDGTLFLMGVMFYNIWKGKASKTEHLLAVYAALLPGIFQNYELLTVNLILVGIFYLLVYGKLKFLEVKPLIFLGEISYALYLVHQKIGYIIQLQMVEHQFTNQVLLVLVPFAMAVLLATIITFYVEKPISKKLRDALK